MNCKRFLVKGLTVEKGRIVYKEFYIPCKSWNCPICARNKAIKLGNTIKEGFRNEQVRFATLTMHRNRNLTEASLEIKSAWNRLRLAITRKFGAFKYVWVVEGHKKSGMPHLHILINTFIPIKWLSRTANRCGFGYIADIRAVRGERVFGYILKYLSKGMGSATLARIHSVKKLRRYSKSRSIKNEAFSKGDFTTLSISDFIRPMEELARFANRAQERAGIKPESTKVTPKYFEMVLPLGDNFPIVNEALRLFKINAISRDELEYFLYQNFTLKEPPEGGFGPWDRFISEEYNSKPAWAMYGRAPAGQGVAVSA